jgi:hypothetical protein
MLASSLAVAALAGPRDRAAPSPLTGLTAGEAGQAGRGHAAGGRALAPLLATAVPAAPVAEGAQLPASGGGDWLDLSTAAQQFLDRFRDGNPADSVAGELLAGEVGRYLDAALEQLTAQIGKVFQLLGMSAADAEATAGGLNAPMAGQARASIGSFHMESQQISASSEVTATGSRQSLSLVVQSIDIAIDQKTGTVTVTQQSLSVSVEIRTGDRVQASPLILDLAGNGDALATLGDRLFDGDGDGKIDRPAWMDGGAALLRLDRDDGPAAGPTDDGILRLRLRAEMPLGLDLRDGRLVAGGRFDRADGGSGGPAAALLDLEA